MGNLASKYDQADYEKAINVLRMTIDWVQNIIAPYKDNEDFFKYTNEYDGLKLLFIEKCYTNCRGNGEIHLVLTSTNGLEVTNFYPNYASNQKISLTNYQYAYNNTPQKTIDLAVLIASNWELIQDKVRNIVQSYKESKMEKSDILANFKVD